MSEPQQSKKPCVDAVDRVLIAAEDLFATCGYDAVSISAIAERANVSKANIFHHFQSKRSLYISVLKAAANHSTMLLMGLEETQSGYADRLTMLANGHLTNYLNHPNKSKLLMREILEHTSDAEIRVLQDDFGRNFARVTSLIEKAQTDGEIRQDLDAAIVAVAILATNIFYIRTREQMQESSKISFADDSDLYSTQMMDLLLNGMLSR
ncbi:MAG: TetR/AcrR family transcriptional regulator [Immundisolibacteraceae bacterium]|nr:TetR/AcrR family transcriptional regulator [Immundisolibacteraceae bacterium]